MYSANAFYSFNPTNQTIRINRSQTGTYIVAWYGVDPSIIESGNLQVTAIGENDYAHCKIGDVGVSAVAVRCYAPNGTPVNTLFSVLLGS